MNRKFALNRCEVRPNRSHNAYCRMCHEWPEGIQNPIPKGQLVLVVKIHTSQGTQQSLICEKHARQFHAQLTEEMKKFDAGS